MKSSFIDVVSYELKGFDFSRTRSDIIVGLEFLMGVYENKDVVYRHQRRNLMNMHVFRM